MPLPVSRDELGIVEVVAGEHDDVFRQARAQRHLLVGVEQRDLYPLDLGGVALDYADDRFQRGIEIIGAPISLQSGIEHLPEPVQDDLSSCLPDNAVVDAMI